MRQRARTFATRGSPVAAAATLLLALALAGRAAAGSSAAAAGRTTTAHQGQHPGAALDWSTAGAAAAAQPANGSGRDLRQAGGRMAKPWVACTASWTPMVSCLPSEDPATYTGYVVELFRLVAHDLGWREGADWVLRCMPYSDMMADVLDPNGSCTIAAAGVDVNFESMDSGLKYSWPIYKSGLRIMINGHLEAGSTWAFAAAFHWSLWLSCGGTAVLVGLLIAAIERVSLGAEHASNKGVSGWLWVSLGKIAFVPTHVGDPHTWASRIIYLGYGFLCMVLVFMYTAISASNLTGMKLNHEIHGRADLRKPGVPVVTWEPYVPLLRQRQNITAKGMPWEHDEDMYEMVKALRNGSARALVLDRSIVEYLAGTNDKCDLFVVDSAFESFSLAFGFPPEFPDAAVDRVNEAVVRLQTQQGALDMLENTYIKTGGTDECFATGHGGGSHASGSQIELRQVSGLWFILCAATGVCLLWLLGHNIQQDPQSMEKLQALRERITESFAGALSSAGALAAPGASSDGRRGGPAHSSGGAASGALPGTAGAAAEPVAGAALGVGGFGKRATAGSGLRGGAKPQRRSGLGAVADRAAGEGGAAAAGAGARAAPALAAGSGGAGEAGRGGGEGGGEEPAEDEVVMLSPQASGAGDH